VIFKPLGLGAWADGKTLIAEIFGDQGA